MVESGWSAQTGNRKPERGKTKDEAHHVPPLFHNHKGTQFLGKRGPNFWEKGDPKGTLFDVKGDLKFEFFRIVHKEQIG